MKHLLKILLTVMLGLSICACSREEDHSGDQMDVTKQEMIDATGMEIDAPSDASNIQYNIIGYEEEYPIAEVQFELDEQSYSYRAKSTSLLKLYESEDDMMDDTEAVTDISGLSDTWTASALQDISYCDGVEYKSKKHDVVIWLDAVPGILYSLSTTINDDLFIADVANEIFVSTQGDSDSEYVEDATAFEGKYESEDSSTIELTYGGMSVYDVEISIYRLCELEGMGRYEDGQITLELTDPNDKDIEGVLYKESDDTYTIKITQSTWTYISNGDTFTGFKIK